MPKYDIQNVKRGDIVIAELRLTRYRENPDNIPPEQKWDWIYWTCRFTLLRLSLLHIAKVTPEFELPNHAINL
jgi:hypothetical protein